MISTALGDNYESVTVQQLMIADEKTWDKDLVVDIFNQRDQTLILNIPLSCRSINMSGIGFMREIACVQ